MSSICFYFQVHQPYRLAPYSFFDIGSSKEYFDNEKNSLILKKVAEKCYLPTNRLLLKLIEKYSGDFKIAFSISGVALEQFKEYSPQVLDSFQELAETKCVEFLSETWAHSLASLYSEEEFLLEIKLHKALIETYFRQSPKIFRNTELIYSDTIGTLIAKAGFSSVLIEGCDDILGWRSPNFIYQHPENNLNLLLKNYKLSDDIAFRFSNRAWQHWPLQAEKYAGWLHELPKETQTVNLFMDYETFGEHQWEDTGIFNFLEKLPECIFHDKKYSFNTPSEIIQEYQPVARLSVARITSWADAERDITAWQGNNMQKSALDKIYSLEKRIFEKNEPEMVTSWRKLLTSDHFYYMSTKWFSDGDVHAYFSPYTSPYEAFTTYMNCVNDFEKRI